jgi:DnaJ-class molecular chaperone
MERAMATRDPYTVLGVKRDASAAEIKSAYRKLAKRYHPDTSKDDSAAEAKFAEASTAYDLLSDPDKRGQFDRGEIDAEGKPSFASFGGFGGPGGGGRGFDPRRSGGFGWSRGGTAGGGAGGPSGGGFSGSYSAGGPEAGDLFDDLFAGLRGAGFSQKDFARTSPFGGTETERVVASVPLEALVVDAQTEVKLPNGRTIKVKLPPGTREGSEVRLKGQGTRDPRTGQTRDVIVSISIQQHPDFTIVGDDLRVTVPAGLDDIILGGKVKVPVLGGSVQLTIPPKADTGQTFRIRGKGLPRKKSGKGAGSGSGQGPGQGDVLVSLGVNIPDDRMDELAPLMENWRKTAAKA